MRWSPARWSMRVRPRRRPSRPASRRRTSLPRQGRPRQSCRRPSPHQTCSPPRPGHRLPRWICSGQQRTWGNGCRSCSSKAGAMSGKPGRPPEDRLRRQHEIFLAVVPLIERYGAKRLTMRQAARAAHLSLGGLYHYVPTKRDLVLQDRKSTRLNSSHTVISYAVFCLKKKNCPDERDQHDQHRDDQRVAGEGGVLGPLEEERDFSQRRRLVVEERVSVFFLMIRLPPKYTLFPYTTLFRSDTTTLDTTTVDTTTLDTDLVEVE